MPIVDDADIQIHLPIDKLRIEEIPDDLASVKTDAERIIRGYLAGVFSATWLATWITPAATPKLIRAIGGRLGAALIYRTRYSEDSLDDPEYAQNKYAEAMTMLNAIIAGTMVLEEAPTGETSTGLNPDFFWPNATTDDPKFTMDSQF